MKQFIAGTLSVLGLVILCSAAVQAATLPGTVQPGQIEQQFQPEPKIRADQPARIVVPEADQPAPPNAQKIRFKLTRLKIEDATVYPESDLLSGYRSRLGAEVTLAEIYQIASTLTAKYRNDGYILSRIVVPAQTIENGDVRLRAIEGYIDRVTVEGVEADWRKLVERYAEQIQRDRPLTSKVLERYLLLMNDLPGAFAKAVIKPSPTEHGASELTVQFSQRRVDGGLSLDNRGGKSLGPWRLSGDIGLNSALDLQESTRFRFVASESGELAFLSLSHDENIGSNGGKLTLSLSAVESEPEELAFIPLNLETSSRSGSLTYSYPLIRSRAENLSLRGSIASHDGKTRIFGIQDTRDRIRTFRLGATYDRADMWGGVNLLDIELSQGIDGLGASENQDPLLSRLNGRVDFTNAALYAARLQSLTKNWSLLAAVNAQYAWTDLLSSELYSFGGEQFGRGYDPSELVGDHGAAMKIELRYSDLFPGGFVSYTGYGFYDTGIVYQRSSAGFSSSESAASAGLGLRMGMGRYLSLYVELAKALTCVVAAEGNRDRRVYWGASIRF